MSKSIHIANAFIVNEGKICKGDLIIENNFISKIALHSSLETPLHAEYINAEGLYLLPGIIDDQVHFREPGLTDKADIEHESRAAVAGGVTSFMEMPNTKPAAVTIDLLEQKYVTAAQKSMANYSFYMGVTNDNAEEVLKLPLDSVCGVKMFLGSSTGNLLVDNEETIEKIFANTKHIVAVHCEDDEIIENNLQKYTQLYGEQIPVSLHHKIRTEEACFASSSKAVRLAKKHNTRLHVLHISTADELSLFENKISPVGKKITAEACVHHLWFTSQDYEQKGTLIKWNPSVKEQHHREALRAAVNSGLIDVIATDHAPHLLSEKDNVYNKAPSGAPIVQFSLQMMLELVHQKIFSLEHVVKMMCHNPALLFQIDRRGFIREGWYADLVLVDMNMKYSVSKEHIFSKCGWSPLEHFTFQSTIDTTFVNGQTAWQKGNFYDEVRGMRLRFNRTEL